MGRSIRRRDPFRRRDAPTAYVQSLEIWFERATMEDMDNTLEIKFQGPARHRRLHVRGELDLVSSQDLMRALRRACEEGARSVMLDLHDVGHMDSSGIYALLSGRKICRRTAAAT